MGEDPERVTQLLEAASGGDPAALERLAPMVYHELRRLAAGSLRQERLDHTLQPTALANEAWIRLVGQDRAAWRNRAQFFAVAATAIRRILVDHARRRRAVRRGGMAEKVPLDDVAALAQQAPARFLELDEALQRLAQQDARKARMIELRFFTGLDIAQTAAALDIGHATVERDWAFARAWLQRELS